MNDQLIEALADKPLEKWTVEEIMAYCRSAAEKDQCETADCLLCDFCLPNFKVGPLHWGEDE